MPTLGRFIQRRRNELGLTQEQLAELVGDGVRQAEISRLERDRVTLPRRQRLEQIARALDVPLGELLVRSGWAGADVIDEVAPPVAAPGKPGGTQKPDVSGLTTALQRAEELIAVADEIVEKSHFSFGDARRVVSSSASSRTHNPEKPAG